GYRVASSRLRVLPSRHYLGALEDAVEAPRGPRTLPDRLEPVLILGMDYGLVLFTSDRGITPAAAAKLADDHGFATFYVPEHTHIPVKREAAPPPTGDESLPDDRYMRTLDPWVSLGTAVAVTSRVRLS